MGMIALHDGTEMDEQVVTRITTILDAVADRGQYGSLAALAALAAQENPWDSYGEKHDAALEALVCTGLITPVGPSDYNITYKMPDEVKGVVRNALVVDEARPYMTRVQAPFQQEKTMAAKYGGALKPGGGERVL